MAPPPLSSPPPPMVDEGYHAGDRLGVHALAPVGTLLGLACITTGLRIYWRLQPSQRIGADDYTLLFALFVTIAWYGIDAAMYHHGRGLEGFRPDPWIMGPLIVAGGVLWVWGINVVRISVALMLLRFRDSLSLPWTMTVWAVIGVQTCMLAVGTIMHLVICRPISARWAPTPSASCIKPTHFMMYGYLYSGFTIASDLILSLLPITFIGYLGPGSPVINVEQDILWGLELTIGVLAASIPSLKAPTYRILRSWGLLRSRSNSDMSLQSFLDRLPNGSHVSRRMGQWQHAVPVPDPRTEGGSGEEMLKGSEASCRSAALEDAVRPGW
ncbi:hypothetical protein L209DRAFT_741296 [Thermothelomyces heterothallicus CBS 203.75]